MEPERRLTDPQELLRRQVHPEFDKADRIQSPAFKPEDGQSLSVDRQRIDAQLAYERYVTATRKSAGTWCVAVHEFGAQDISGIEDGGTADLPDGHVSMDYSQHGRRAIERKAKNLAFAAFKRGCAYRPEMDQ